MTEPTVHPVTWFQRDPGGGTLYVKPEGAPSAVEPYTVPQAGHRPRGRPRCALAGSGGWAMSTPAEELRAAAQRVRELAKDATGGEWMHFHDTGDRWYVEAGDGHTVAETAPCEEHEGRARIDAHWIAAMSPAIAEPLAKLLEWCEDAIPVNPYQPLILPAQRLARAILATTPIPIGSNAGDEQ